MFAQYQDQIEEAMIFNSLTATPESIIEALQDIEEIRQQIESVDVWDIGPYHRDAYEEMMNDSNEIIVLAGGSYLAGSLLRAADPKSFDEHTRDYYNAFASENEAFPERKEALELANEYIDMLRAMAYRESMFERFTLSLPGDEIDAFPASGRCDDAVESILEYKSVSLQLDEIGAKKIREELREYGAWEEDELSDDAENRKRIVWIAACNIKEDAE